MAAYYNENNPYAAQWLRNLIAAGCIPPGTVDERSIEDVCAADLVGYTQCHFFAGIGGWPYALRQAGWPDDRPVWTGSCPCQPFSKAGHGNGFDDQRHLWPYFFHFICQQRPAIVFGEQVASTDAEPWVDLIQSDMEGVGYVFGAVSIPAAGFGAPHIRDRLYWVGHAIGTGLERHAGHGRYGKGWPEAARSAAPTGPLNSFWRDAEWISGADGKYRPIEPGTFPLADGFPERVEQLRAYGNAICVPVATEFICSYCKQLEL